MSRHLVESCDVCRRIVSKPLKAPDDRSTYGDALGYIVAKRWKWRFTSARWWHRVKDDDFIVCDFCIADIRAAAPTKEDTDE